MEELRAEGGVRERLTRKLVTRGKNGRVRLTKRADALRVEGRRRRGRPRLRWKDCIKRYFAGVGEVGGEWRMRARDRWEWRMRARDRWEWRTRARDRWEWRMRARDRWEWRMRAKVDGSGE